MEEKNARRGKLKIFLGYAEGVGKTYAMLEAAQQRKQEGVDVVIGWVETYNQLENELLLADLEIILPVLLPEGGRDRREMDLDSVLARHPDLVLVDELAHSNAPGARHAKRYQDVEELLDGGSDVYTTLNIQNLGSLHDVVFQITGVRIDDTIPDIVFDRASIIELVDLPPDELLQRFRDGRIHISESLAPHANQFFRQGNLIALRELSMRRVAGQLDTQMQAYMTDRAIPGPWAASERLMVCISSHPISERLVRAGQRLAGELSAEWYVAYIETPERLHYSQEHQNRLTQTLNLAEELGAHIIKTSGRKVPETVVEFARRQNITKIIVGKPLRPRWLEFISGSVVDEIIRQSGQIDVYVISDESGPLPTNLLEAWKPHGRWIRYFYSILLVAGATVLGSLIQGYFHPVNLVMLYLMAVILSAAYFGRGPSMLASFLSVLAFDFFFVHPQFQLDVSDTQYLLTFGVLLAAGLIISNLSGLVRDQVEISREREGRASMLYNLSRELTVLVDPPAILNTVIQQIAQTFSRESSILLPEEGQLEVRAVSSGLVLDEPEKEAAAWAFKHGQPAGSGTSTLPQVWLRYQPLRTPHGMIGVLGFRPNTSNGYLSPDQRQFLDAYSSLAALAIERAYLAEQASRAQLISATEKLQSSLLNSISHDLRTPLATITGVFSSLHEADRSDNGRVQLSRADRLELVETGWEEARRLNRLVGNLLEMTRLESGALKLRCQSGDVQDVIGSTLRRMGDRLNNIPILTRVPENLSSVSADFVLIELVLINLLDNAIKYSPAGSPIEIEARPLADEVEISVSDHGIGIPDEDLPRVFDKFFRVQRQDNTGGTGLGLSICKGIVEAHGTHILAENRPGGGTTIRFTLPIEDSAV
jgi:two-component system, OmpR family, sensor histidine kinase KdpD